MDRAKYMPAATGFLLKTHIGLGCTIPLPTELNERDNGKLDVRIWTLFWAGGLLFKPGST